MRRHPDPIWESMITMHGRGKDHDTPFQVQLELYHEHIRLQA